MTEQRDEQRDSVNGNPQIATGGGTEPPVEDSPTAAPRAATSVSGDGYDVKSASLPDPAGG